MRAAAAVAVAALVLAGCGGEAGKSRSTGLEWKKEPLVFRATHRATNQAMAVKVLSPDFPQGDAELQNFVRVFTAPDPGTNGDGGRTAERRGR